MPDQLFIGYDPGRGNTDVCVNGSVSSVQSVVALGGEDLILDGLDAVVADAHAVHYAGQRYWVGQGAWAKGLVLQAMSDSALAPAGSDQPHNNLQPYLTFYFNIALQGVFPPRT